MRVDNFALTMHQACPAKYHLRMIEGWTSRRKSGALGFGGAFHEGLATWYKNVHLPREERISASIAAIKSAWDDSVPPDDYRNLQKCIETFKEYAVQYPAESFTPVIGPDGALIEVSFTIDTGLTTDDGEPIEYGGIFDGLVEFGSNVYILEHKTTSAMGPYYFNQYKPNNQVTGYVWAARQLSGRRVGGAIINAICVTKTGKAKFGRQITTRTEYEIERWLKDVQSTCNEIRRHQREGHWPMRTPSCMQYGACEFYNVHVLANPTEQQVRLEQDYIHSPWDYEGRDEAKGSDSQSGT